MAFSPDGKFILSGSHDKTIKLWESSTGYLLRTFQQKSRVISLAFSASGSSFICGSTDKTIKLLDIKTGDVLHTFEGHKIM